MATILSKRATEILKAMIEAEDAGDYDEAEIVCEGAASYLGYQRISIRSANQLLSCLAIKSVSEPGALERYTVSDTGRKILADPAVAAKVVEALLRGVPCDASGNPLSDDGNLPAV